MRSLISTKLLLFLALFLFFSCADKGDWTSDVHELLIDIEEETVMIGSPLKFTDLSLGVKSRTWTFEDGAPATSSAPVVEVSFISTGRKKVTLDLVYDNGRTQSETYYVEVVEPLTGTIEVVGLSPMGAVALDQNVQFNLETSGDPTSYRWTFPGGSPATSEEQNPTVSWGRRGFVTVQLELTRALDGITEVIEQEIHVGNYPMLRAYTVADMDSWSFEAGTRIGKWTAWNTVAGQDEVLQSKVTRVSEGADGTAYSMRVAYNRAGQAWEMMSRDNWTNNAQLEKGKTYEFVFWMKADVPFTFGEAMIFNELPIWSWNELLNAHAGNNWNDYFPEIPFQEQGHNRFAYIGNFAVTTSWQKFRTEFTIGSTDLHGNTVPDKLLNAYPFFYFNTTAANYIYIDEIQINIIED